MSPIMPITQFEYIQYTNRTVAAESFKKNGITGFRSVQPVPSLRRNQSGVFFDAKNREDVIYPLQSLNTGSQNPYISESDLTGVGKLIDVSV